MTNPQLQVCIAKPVDRLIPDSPYSSLNLNTTIEVDELNQLRQRLQQNIGFINLNRPRIRHQEFTQLMNYHQYALNVLNNMINVKKVEYNNPYNRNVRNFRAGERTTPIHSPSMNTGAIYDDRGAVKIVTPQDFKIKEEWETQFDQNIINPPCYIPFPTNCFRGETLVSRGAVRRPGV